MQDDRKRDKGKEGEGRKEGEIALRGEGRNHHLCAVPLAVVAANGVSCRRSLGMEEGALTPLVAGAQPPPPTVSYPLLLSWA